MPTMWFAKDGLRPHSQSGPGIAVTSEEVTVIVAGHAVHFIGLEAPSINPDQPSHSLKNVVLEVEEQSDASALLPEVGFYLVPGLLPSKAQSRLDASRESA